MWMVAGTQVMDPRVRAWRDREWWWLVAAGTFDFRQPYLHLSKYQESGVRHCACRGVSGGECMIILLCATGVEKLVEANDGRAAVAKGLDGLGTLKSF